MIGKLTGIVEDIEEDHILLDVHGVGYLVYCAPNVLKKITPTIELKLYIFSYIREDAHKLYGFLTKEERQWFLLLRHVQKVGPKHALAILGQFSLDELYQIIISQNSLALTKTSGIGKMLAEKIIHELKGKMGSMALPLTRSPFAIQEDENLLKSSSLRNFDDALSGLTNLGYNKEQAKQALHKVLQQRSFEEESQDTATLLRLALKICGAQ